MKALSLTQPWAMFMASGRKQIGTRSWSTRYRGPLYIHAAKRFPPTARQLALEIYGNPAVIPYLPLGAIVARAYLLDVRPTEAMLSRISAEEARLGDYNAGRFAWILSNIEQLEPIPWKGALGLFDVPKLEARLVLL